MKEQEEEGETGPSILESEIQHAIKDRKNIKSTKTDELLTEFFKHLEEERKVETVKI